MKSKILYLLLALILIIVSFLLLTNFVFVSEKDFYNADYKPDNIIDHNDTIYIKEYLKNNPEINIAEKAFLFSHASVGSNIIDGIKRNESSIFNLKTETCGAQASAEKKAGYIMHYPRGNPGFDRKIEIFGELVKEWSSKTDVVIDKFCYIDIIKYDQNLSEEENKMRCEEMSEKYIQNMNELSKLYPNLIFVYTTMPLTSKDSFPNIMREFYNSKIREYCKNNNLILYDIADIESNGEKTDDIEYLSGKYTWDGGHLNPKGQTRLAKGFFAVSAYIAANY